jgi:hypothetical protein
VLARATAVAFALTAAPANARPAPQPYQADDATGIPHLKDGSFGV